MKLPLLLSVPHGGSRVPEEVARYNRLSAMEIAEDGDGGAAEIYDLGDEVGAYASAEIARAFVDLNRAEDDRRADGVVKTHTCWDVPVYDPFPPQDVIEQLLDRYYRPYHRRLAELAGAGVRLGIDCHTMAAKGPPAGPLAGKERPRICLSDRNGTTCPARTFEIVTSSLAESFEFQVSRNFPFQGGFITRTHATELPWVQLELSRAEFLPTVEKRERVLRALRLIADRL